MEFNSKKCEKCGAYLVLNESGGIPTRLAPLNWWECPNCGREELKQTIITTTTRSLTAAELHRLADEANARITKVEDIDLFNYLYRNAIEDANEGLYESKLLIKTKDFPLLQSVCAHFTEMGFTISCVSQDDTSYTLTIKF